MTSPSTPDSTAARSPVRRRLRWAIFAVGLVLLVLVGPPVALLGWTAFHDQAVVHEVRAGYAGDVSGLIEVPVAEVWPVPEEREAAVAGLQALLKRAEAENLQVSIAGARHTMGGHTIARDGIVVEMASFDHIELAPDGSTVTVGAGATWAEVLRAIDPAGRSVAVMQSNDTFSVGGSVSVNCHGWQHGRPPVASTVRSMRVLLADGRILNCSRTREPELFRAALGGYGLFGILLEVELELTDNELYRTVAQVLPVEELGPAFLAATKRDDVGMVIGRVSIDPKNLMQDAILKTLFRVEQEGALPPIVAAGRRTLRRTVFRASASGDYGKRLRWFLEKSVGTRASDSVTTRNTELAEPVDFYSNDDPEGTDILHEYFVPHGRLASFLDAIRPVMQKSGANLMNITVRDIRRDDDTLLAYAREDVFSLVMYFHQKLTPEAEAAMVEVTRALTDCALAEGGAYYLPYRLHATVEQFQRAYPSSLEFLRLKRQYDPNTRFSNEFFRTYWPQ